jgi:hypothetical protein
LAQAEEVYPMQLEGVAQVVADLELAEEVGAVAKPLDCLGLLD